MTQNRLPAWMTTRSHREIPEVEKTSMVPELVASSICIVFVLGGVLAALLFEPVFHLAVIGASIAMFALVLVSKAEGSKRNFGVFGASAVAVNALMAYVSTVIEHDSALVAIAAVALFTGLIGLLLLSRTRENPSRRVKAAVMGATILVTVTGPILYPISHGGEVLEYVRGWFLLVSIPMIFVSFITGLVLISYHRHAQTLPSDKWV